MKPVLNRSCFQEEDGHCREKLIILSKLTQTCKKFSIELTVTSARAATAALQSPTCQIKIIFNFSLL
jgi:hypothetical protein